MWRWYRLSTLSLAGQMTVMRGIPSGTCPFTVGHLRGLRTSVLRDRLLGLRSLMLIWTALLENAFQIVVVGSLLAEVHGSLVARWIIVASRRGRSGRLRHRRWLSLQSDFRCIFCALGQEWFRVKPHLEVVNLLADVVQVE